MDRRQFLRGTAAAVALPATGCIGAPTGDRSTVDESDSGDTSDSGGTTDSENDGHSAADGGWRPIDELSAPPEEPRVVDFETAPLTAAVPGGRVSTAGRFIAHVYPTGGATADSPAMITALIANRQPYEQTIRPRQLPVLDDPTVPRTDGHDSIYLAPADDHPLAETSPEYVRDEDGRWRIESVRDDWYPETVTAPAESGIAATYYLLGHHDSAEPPIQTGRYRVRAQDGSVTIAVWPTNAPGPDERSSLAGASPPVLPDAEEMAWFHDATAGTGAYLKPARETVELPAAVSVELYNYSRDVLGGNPYYWRLSKLVDGQWYPIAPWAWNQPLQELAPGSRIEDRLVLFHGDPITLREHRTVGHLGGGRYAYEVDFSADGETHATLLEIDAPELTVEPESSASVVETGETVVVELPDYADARQPGTLTVEQVAADPSTADQMLIAEQLPRRPFRAIRNALPRFADGVERVEVRTDRGTALEPLGYESDATKAIAYEGAVYRLSGSLEAES